MRDKKFTLKSHLYSVYHCKEFAPFKQYRISPRCIPHLRECYSLSSLRHFYPVDPTTLAYALNERKERLKKEETLFYPGEKKETGIFSFLVGENRPFVLILPGGGYGDVCSLIEGFTVALHLNKRGFNAFIGLYRVGKQAHYPNPIEDVASARKFILAHSEEFKINKDSYSVIGFSAGGHLAGLYGSTKRGYKNYTLPKPERRVLSYPVITRGEYTHKGTRKNFLGKHPTEEEIKDYSVDQLVDEDFPKTFLWQCKEDKVVPFKNTLLREEALKKHHIPYQCVGVDGNKHGLGLGVGSKAEGWLDKAIDFWRKK